MSHITGSLCEGIYPGVRLFFPPTLQPVCLITGLKKTLFDVGIHSTVGVMVIYLFLFFYCFCATVWSLAFVFGCPNIRKQLGTVEGAAAELHNECEMIARMGGK